MSARHEGILLHEAVAILEGIAAVCQKHGCSSEQAEAVGLSAAKHWINRRLKTLYAGAGTPAPNRLDTKPQAQDSTRWHD